MCHASDVMRMRCCSLAPIVLVIPMAPCSESHIHTSACCPIAPGSDAKVRAGLSNKCKTIEIVRIEPVRSHASAYFTDREGMTDEDVALI